ncbi:MAG TPA: tetratricopeptide repeat protein [Pirellulales bacterium]|nr:tetratricopeptide repeat protein [Pirellulales bacterium]
MKSRKKTAPVAPSPVRRSVVSTIRLSHRGWLPGLLLVAMVGLAYAPAFRGRYVLDDDVYVTGNSALRSADGLRRIWFEPGSVPDYYTLVYSTFWVEYHLWGLAPLGYHAVNIALHAISAVLLWRLLVRLCVPGAWLAAAIFAVHPVCVESVAWIAERKNTLSLLFGLASMLCYLRFEPIENSPSPARSMAETPCKFRWRYYAAALVLFALALLSKTQVVALPAVLLVLYWWKRGSIGWRTVIPLTPFFLLGFALAAVTVWIETVYNGASAADGAASLLERILIAGRALWFYPSKLIWPNPLTFINPRWTIDANVWWQYLFPLAAVTVLAVFWLARGKIGRGPLAAALIFAGLLLPVLGFCNVCYQRFSFVADHFQYHAAAALIALITATGWKIAGRWTAIWARKMAQAAAVAIVGVFMLLSWQQSRLYGSAEVLYRDTLTKNPDCWLAYNNLGNALEQAGRVDEAIAEYQAALQLKPDYAEAHVNLGTALAESNQTELAIEQYRQALTLKPNYAQAHNHLGVALAKAGQSQQALAEYQEALRLNPNDADAHNNWGTLLLDTGKRQAALEHFQAALLIDADDAAAHSNLGNALQQLGRTHEAMEQFAEALQLNPNLAEAHNLLGAAWVSTGHVPQAIQQYQLAVQLKPNYAEAHFNLGIALVGCGQPAAAIEHFQEVLRLSPNDLVCALNLAVAYARTNQHQQAVAAAHQAAEIAHATGQKARAQEIQSWLSAYEASTDGSTDVRPASYDAPAVR